uniref:Uncharacterized protein n=1 Tax=Triticum urartu TaxID=4572 RepID=A0A8R7K2S9_TRIUA
MCVCVQICMVYVYINFATLIFVQMVLNSASVKIKSTSTLLLHNHDIHLDKLSGGNRFGSLHWMKMPYFVLFSCMWFMQTSRSILLKLDRTEKIYAYVQFFSFF